MACRRGFTAGLVALTALLVGQGMHVGATVIDMYRLGGVSAGGRLLPMKLLPRTSVPRSGSVLIVRFPSIYHTRSSRLISP